MQCEMCGKEAPHTKRFLIERTILNVGPECERFGKPLDPTSAGMRDVRPGNVPLAMEMRKKRTQGRDVFSEASMQVELVQDFGQRIQLARERKGWTRQDLGGRVGEREAAIQRIESGSLRPTDDIAKKMERELGIQLYEKVDAVVTKRQTGAGMTLGDVLRDAMAKDKKR